MSATVSESIQRNNDSQKQAHGSNGCALPAFDALCHVLVPIVSVNKFVYEEFVETLDMTIRGPERQP